MGNPWNDSDGFAREAAKVESAGEAVLLSLLWWRRDGWTARAQHPIGDYRIDLFIPEAGLAIEVDSFEAHGSGGAQERDAQKRNLIVARGWAPLSFSARQALFRSQETLATVLARVNERLDARKVRRGADVARAAVAAQQPDLEQAAACGNRLLQLLASVRPEENDWPVLTRPSRRMGGA